MYNKLTPTKRRRPSPRLNAEIVKAVLVILLNLPHLSFGQECSVNTTVPTEKSIQIVQFLGSEKEQSRSFSFKPNSPHLIQRQVITNFSNPPNILNPKTLDLVVQIGELETISLVTCSKLQQEFSLKLTALSGRFSLIIVPEGNIELLSNQLLSDDVDTLLLGSHQGIIRSSDALLLSSDNLFYLGDSLWESVKNFETQNNQLFAIPEFITALQNLTTDKLHEIDLNSHDGPWLSYLALLLSRANNIRFYTSHMNAINDKIKSLKAGKMLTKTWLEEGGVGTCYIVFVRTSDGFRSVAHLFPRMPIRDGITKRLSPNELGFYHLLRGPMGGGIVPVTAPIPRGYTEANFIERRMQSVRPFETGSISIIFDPIGRVTVM